MLEGARVRVEPLAFDHVSALAGAAEDRSAYRYTWVPDGLAETEQYVQAALDHYRTGRALPWAVRRLSDGQIVGTTRFLDLEVFTWPPPWPPGVNHGPAPDLGHLPTVAEIGSTWYAASAQRTGINAEVKYLQLDYAFDGWRVRRVTLKTDARNVKSRTLIERLGAVFDGIRRAHSSQRRHHPGHRLLLHHRR